LGGWVYILASAPYGTLYVGVTSDISRRVFEHREGIGSAFCQK
jgi:putative endonuclease